MTYISYEKSMKDRYGDDCTVTAMSGEVYLEASRARRSSLPALATDMAFSPEEALKLSRILIRAAMAAQQERDATR